ncbi:MAG: xanthine phosphoribosyltransferase [Anaerolineae bacterium]|nr:xanthine phosphoribosyltransferase [Anaerolineae bacterium]
MEELKRLVREEGQNLGNGILKVDGFINHQIDPLLMRRAGEELARRFAGKGVTKIFTAEISGIAPALAAGLALEVPVVFARKRKPVTMTEPVYVESAPSHTKGVEVLLMASPEYLKPEDRILVVDDFLASGHTLAALVRLVEKAHATLVGIGVLIEKEFEGGREALSTLDVPIESLVTIAAMEDDRIILAE